MSKQIITPELQNHVKENITLLKFVLKDDKEFAEQLIENILLLGGGKYINDISSLISEKYAYKHHYNDPQYLVNLRIKEQLEEITYEIARVMGRSEFCKDEIYDLPDNEQDEYFAMLRNEVKDEICNVFDADNPDYLDIGSINLIGEN